jgi:hypothetical protein
MRTEHVAGQDGPLDHLALAVLDLRDLLGGDHDLVDVVLHVEADDAVLEVRLHPVLHAGVGVHDEPLAGLGPQLATERLQRVVVGDLGVGLGLLGARLGLVGEVLGRLVRELLGSGDGLVERGLVGLGLDRVVAGLVGVELGALGLTLDGLDQALVGLLGGRRIELGVLPRWSPASWARPARSRPTRRTAPTRPAPSLAVLLVVVDVSGPAHWPSLAKSWKTSFPNARSEQRDEGHEEDHEHHGHHEVGDHCSCVGQTTLRSSATTWR